MIELSPKALRFARLAAEAHDRGADAPLFAELKRREAAPRHAGHGVEISDDLGRFCLDRIGAFLDREPFDDDQWDANDRLYLEAIAAQLSRSLSRDWTTQALG